MHMYIELTCLFKCTDFPPVCLSTAQVIALFYLAVEVYFFYNIVCDTQWCLLQASDASVPFCKSLALCLWTTFNNLVAVTGSTHPNFLDNICVYLWEAGHQQEQQAHLILTLDWPALYQQLLSNQLFVSLQLTASARPAWLRKLAKPLLKLKL